MHYYSHHIGDFLTDAGSLPNESLGAYMRMLWRYYADESPLTGEVEDIAFDAGTTPEIARQLLRRFFVRDGDGWAHVRCDKEIAKYHGKAEKAKKSADARWNGAKPKRTQCERNANASDSDANQQPITNKKQDQKQGRAPLALPEWLSAETWGMWHDFRNSRKGWTAKARALSLGSLTRLRAAGHDPRLVIEQSIERGYTGLFPLKPNGANHHAAPRLSLADQAAAFHANRDRDDAIDGTFTPIDR